ncbi:MAG TPA: PIG-L family deacetylase, partial [Chthoniobacterales bacterium]
MLGLVLMSGATVGAVEPTPRNFPPPMNAAEIQLALQKLNVLGRVLYVAAHPDDENTNLMALWSNGSLYDTAYLSVTRGDGGQNLIGPELGERLGFIRTHELLAARKIDHANQFFTRAVDFGFSKSASETLRIWDREKILADVVWTIRKWKPDVVVTRFSPDDDKTHGHHTASAILAREAFAVAADPKRFPEQLAYVEVWKPTRLVWNTSPFFFQNRNIPFDPAGLATLEAGGFNPLLGKAFTEIAAAALSMHKSQGVGSPPRRGARKEYFKLLEGAPMKDTLFDKIDTSWARVPKSEAIAEKVKQLIATYAPADPSASVPKLLELRKQLIKSEKNDWFATKRGEVDTLIAACLALHIESSTTNAVVSPGQTLPTKFDAIDRSNVPVQLFEARAPVSGEQIRLDVPLAQDAFVSKDLSPTVPKDVASTQPYWLRKPPALGTYVVDDQKLIGLPENPPPFPLEVTVRVGDQDLRYLVDTKYRTVDRVIG